MTYANPSTLDLLVDRQAIADCLARFSRGMDRLDREIALSAFHPDAICDYGPYAGSPDGLFDWAEQVAGGATSTHHHLSNQSCEISGDTAHCETYLLYNAVRAEGTMWQAHGRYIDRFERRDGEWRIAMRYCVIEAAGTVARSEEPFPGIADIFANGSPAFDRTDPSYRRPLINRRGMRAIGAQ